MKWNTFMGGQGEDWGADIALDSLHNIYVAGEDSSTWGDPVRPFIDEFDGFVVQLNPKGELKWNTFLGGNGEDEAFGIALDGNANVYVTGESTETWGQPKHPLTVEFDAFIAKIE